MRVLILSWEYPPLIEGGLARHVRKLAENMAAQGVDVHVLARGREEDLPEEEVGGVLVHGRHVSTKLCDEGGITPRIRQVIGLRQRVRQR